MNESLNSVTLQREVNVALAHDNTSSNRSEAQGNNQSDVYFIAKVRILNSSGNVILSNLLHFWENENRRKKRVRYKEDTFKVALCMLAGFSILRVYIYIYIYIYLFIYDDIECM